MNKEDGTTEVKAIGRVSKRHLVQALLMLATAETGTSVPGKKNLKKLNVMCRASLVQMVFEEMNDDATRDEG